MNEYFGDQYCPFCDNETDGTSLKEHGKICPEYKETLKDTQQVELDLSYAISYKKIYHRYKAYF